MDDLHHPSAGGAGVGFTAYSPSSAADPDRRHRAALAALSTHTHVNTSSATRHTRSTRLFADPRGSGACLHSIRAKEGADNESKVTQPSTGADVLSMRLRPGGMAPSERPAPS